MRALKGAGAEVKAKFLLDNMSERVRGFIQTEIDLLDELDPEEIQKVRQSILHQVVALAEEGHVDWPPNVVQQEPYVPAQHLPPDFYDLARYSLDQLGFDQIAALCRELAEQARREGVLSLEQVAAQMEISFFREALILIVDGTEPALI